MIGILPSEATRSETNCSPNGQPRRCKGVKIRCCVILSYIQGGSTTLNGWYPGIPHDMHEISLICRWCCICLAEILKSAETNSIFLDNLINLTIPLRPRCIPLLHVTPSKTMTMENTQPFEACISYLFKTPLLQLVTLRQEALHFSSFGMCPEFFDWCLWNLPRWKLRSRRWTLNPHFGVESFTVIREEINYLVIQCDLFISQSEVT